ncbi:MAG: hypothetical protein JSU83_22315 [Deltaproteobacteria bacterium]|nr:MAG: hypothetical protein JSU83_22315 [Deltaproteobacteria bacterium]
MARSIIHFTLHLLVPGAVSRIAFKNRWQMAWFMMALTLLVDFDHLLAVPIYDPNRCGIGFHPLHSYPAIGIYFLMAAIPKIRIIATGLLIHMGLDITDCIWMRWG